MITRNISIISLLIMTLSLRVSAQADLPLIEAAKNRDMEEVSLLLNNPGIDVNAGSADDTSALHWAVHWDERDMVDMLLAAGADPNPANDYGVTPLMQACVNRNDDMVVKLLDAGADPNVLMITGVSALMKCSQAGAQKAVVALIKAGADVNISESRKDQTALMWAANSAHASIVQSLIDAGADVSSRTPGGFTPLMFAARSGDIESARSLLDAGADPDEASDKEGNALVIASAGGHEELALYLLSRGADPGFADEYGITALHNAVRAGLSALHGVRYDPVYRIQPDNMNKLARALLDAGADPNAQIIRARKLGPDGTPFSMVGATPLMLAAVSADIELMRLMMEYEADPQINSEGGNTPLMAAARAACTGSCAFMGGNVEVGDEDINISLEAVKLAVEMGVDVNATNEVGRTALHMAAFTGSDAVVQYLAEHGADVNVSDINGETPWSMASGISPGLRYRGLYGAHESTAALLLKLGAIPVTLEEMNPHAKHRQ